MFLKRHYSLMLALAVIFLISAPATSSANDRIVAVVNSDIITQRQLENRVSSMIKSRRSAGVPQGQIRQKVLEALIDQTLVSQEARKKGVFVTDADVLAAINDIKKKNKLTDAQFRAALAYNGTSYEAFKQDLSSELLKSKIVGSNVISRVVVTDNEVLAFLRGEGPADIDSAVPATGFGTPPPPPSINDNLPVRLLVLPYSKKTGLAKIQKIKNEIDSGLSFADAVKKYSQGPGRDKGGDPGNDLKVSNLAPALRAAAGKIKPGEVTEPVVHENAVLLLTVVDDGTYAKRLSEEKKAKPKSRKSKKALDEYSQEAVNNARLQLERYKMQNRYTKWINDLRTKSVIRINKY